MRFCNGALTGILGVMTALITLLPGAEAHGHGWITSPPSRQDHCARRRTSFDCGPIQWEPQSVEAPKGSLLCSGGGGFRILDEGRPWPVTNVGRTVSLRWNLTAAHRTARWEYFVDGRLFTTVDGRNTHPPTTFTHTLSGLPAGRHTILARWNVADTPMAFYGCLDVNVGSAASACAEHGGEAICEAPLDGEGPVPELEGDDQGGCNAGAGAASPWLALTLMVYWRARRRTSVTTR